MTEQEIIEYLKKNKSEGRIISFMPEEVQKWCEEHKKELLVWQSDRWYEFDADDICTDDAITLPDDYKIIKEESKSRWVEFGIKKNGHFTAFDVDDNDHQISFSFGWHQWSEFIDCSYEHDLGYTAFGGWQYADSNTWFMTPKLKIILAAANSISYKDSDVVGNYCTTPSAVECKPAIPVKIRFWKGE